MGTMFYVWTAVAVFFIALFFASYVKAPSNYAYIIAGISKVPRILIGKGGFRIPFLERLDKVYIGQMSVDIKTGIPVPTSDFINVDVDAVAKIRVIPTDEGVRLAAKDFLNRADYEIAEQLTDSLQGNMREIIGTLDLKSLNTDRDKFSDQVVEKAGQDLAKMGIEIISCNIQNVSDGNGLIKDLGADNTYKIKKDAAISKAIAEREIAVEQSKAAKEANDARVSAETAIAEKNNELVIKKAELKGQSDTRQAIADSAYEIQRQEQQKTVNEKTVEAEIVKTKQEQTLSMERIKIMENELKAEVNAKADSDKYRIEVKAKADLEQRKREAEAKRYEAEQEAQALKAKAEARKFEMEQEALGIKARGDAEAYAIQQKGLAEAEAMDKKAEAYKKYNGAAVAEMMIGILPEMASKVAESIGGIEDIRIYGTDGSGVSQISSNVPVMIRQAMDVVSEATGVDMKDVLRASTIEAKTNRNVGVDVNGVVLPNKE